jgi:hypothetical protein
MDQDVSTLSLNLREEYPLPFLYAPFLPLTGASALTRSPRQTSSGSKYAVLLLRSFIWSSANKRPTIMFLLRYPSSALAVTLRLPLRVPRAFRRCERQGRRSWIEGHFFDDIAARGQSAERSVGNAGVGRGSPERASTEARSKGSSTGFGQKEKVQGDLLKIRFFPCREVSAKLEAAPPVLAGHP